MTSPVLAALASAKAKEERDAAHTLDAGVRKHLELPAPAGSTNGWSVWKAFADKKGIAAMPALPAAIAIFVLNGQALGENLVRVISSISAVHESECLADPTLSPLVIAAMNRIVPIKAPRAWPNNRKIQFARLERDLQNFIITHEKKIETEMRRAQNQASANRKDKSNGIQQQSTPAATGSATVD